MSMLFFADSVNKIATRFEAPVKGVERLELFERSEAVERLEPAAILNGLNDLNGASRLNVLNKFFQLLPVAHS